MDIHQSCSIIYKNEKYTCEKIQKEVKKIIYHIFQNTTVNTKTIAIALPRSPEVLFSILALLELNIVYLPIDLEQPDERIKYILNDSKADYVITTSTLCHRFSDYRMIYMDLMPDVAHIECLSVL